MAGLSRGAGEAGQEPRSVSEALARAYRNAVYTIETAEGPHTLTVDIKDVVLDRLLDAHGVATAARLTAANPGSAAELSPEVNAAANRRLADDLARRGLRWLDCASAAPDGTWREEGLLVLGIRRDEAEALARVYGQSGFLWFERGRPVDLVML